MLQSTKAIMTFDMMPACEHAVADVTVCAERDILAAEVDGI